MIPNQLNIKPLFFALEYKNLVTIQEEITIFWADVDFFRLYN
jgi:hypothetical protein